MTIPRALFDDLEKLDHVLLESSTCACFVSVDARLPTVLARIHLEYRRRLHLASRIDLRRFAGAHSRWLSSVLPRERDRLRLINFPGELPVFLATSTAREDFPSKLESLTRDLSFMLAIEERVNLDNRGRRIRLFRLAVQVLEARASKRGVPSPIGRLAKRTDFNEASHTYLSGKATPLVPFYRYKLMLTSQLRVLYELALAFAEEEVDAVAFDGSDDAYRDHVLDGLERLILQGITIPPDDRTDPRVREFLEGIDIEDAPEPELPLFDGVEAWLDWLPQSARDRTTHKDFWLSVLTQLPAGYDDTIWKLLRELAGDLDAARMLVRAQAASEPSLSI